MAISVSLTVSSIGSTTATLSYSVTGVTGSQVPWEVDFSGGGTLSPAAYGPASSGGNSGTISVTGLTASTSYTWTAQVYTNAGNITGPSASASGTTTGAPPPTSYTVTWNYNGGSGSPASTTVTSGSTTTAPSPTSPSGCTFANWTGNGETIGAGSTTKAITGDVTYTANYNVTVTWNYNGGSGSPASSTAARGSSFTTPIPYRSGYDFLSWTGNSQTLGQNSPTGAINSAVTYTANWQVSAPPTYPPSWSDNSLSSAQATVAYADGVSATNMGYSGSYSVSSGSLPAGLSLNSGSGAVTGTPSAGGTYNFTITATNSYGSVSQAFTFTVAGPPATGKVQVYNGTDWVQSELYVYNGTSWILAPVYVYNGSSWVMAV